MRVFVRVNGLNDVQRNLALFPDLARKEYAEAVKRGGQTLADETKRMRPVSAKTTGYGAKGIPVDSGRLRQSIRSRSLSLLAAGVSPFVGHGIHVHEGTNKMPARHFFDWALELGAQKKIDQHFVDASDRILRSL
jgi:hypothetical protein